MVPEEVEEYFLSRAPEVSPDRGADAKWVSWSGRLLGVPDHVDHFQSAVDACEYFGANQLRYAPDFLMTEARFALVRLTGEVLEVDAHPPLSAAQCETVRALASMASRYSLSLKDDENDVHWGTSLDEFLDLGTRGPDVENNVR